VWASSTVVVVGFGGGWVEENILLSELPAEESIFVLFDKFEVCSSLCLKL